MASENGERRFLSREEILNKEDIVVEEVEVPEWGGFVRVRGLTGIERDRYEDEIVQIKKGGKVVYSHYTRAKMVAMSVVDENGRRMFSEEDIRALGRKSSAALQRVFNKATEMSGLSEKDVEEIEEGLEEAPTVDSSID